MPILKEKVILNNGIEMPRLALGTWFMENDERTVNAVRTAIDIGYRHIDTAQSYKNEQSIGIGIEESKVQRENIFVTSKVDAEIKDYKSAINSVNLTLSNMGLDYLDMMVIHNPQPWTKSLNPSERFFSGNLQVWQALIDSMNEGKVHSIGVSNFTKDDLKNIIDNSEVVPAVNQIAVKVGDVPTDLITYDRENDILTEAYSVVPHGILLSHPEIQQLADKYHVSVSQLCIRFVWQFGLPLWRKSTSKEHIEQNAKIDFEISDSDMNYLKDLK